MIDPEGWMQKGPVASDRPVCCKRKIELETGSVGGREATLALVGVDRAISRLDLHAISRLDLLVRRAR